MICLELPSCFGLFGVQLVPIVVGQHPLMTVRDHEGITHGVTVGTVSGIAHAVIVGTV